MFTTANLTSYCQCVHNFLNFLHGFLNRINVWTLQTVLKDLKIRSGTYPPRPRFLRLSHPLCLRKISSKTSSFMFILLCTREEQTSPNDFSSNIISLYVWLHDDWCELLFRRKCMLSYSESQAPYLHTTKIKEVSLL